MVNNRKSLKKALYVLILLLCGYIGQAQNTESLPLTPSEAGSLASTSLSKTLQWIDPSELGMYGFDRMDDFSAIRTGKPVYQLSYGTNLSGGEKKDIITQTVMIPLWLQGKARCFLYLTKEQDKWTVSGIGGHNEAQLWEKDMLQADRDAQTDRMVLMHILQTNADYLLQPTAQGMEQYKDVTVWKNETERGSELLSSEQVYKEAQRVSVEARQQSGDTN